MQIKCLALAISVLFFSGCFPLALVGCLVGIGQTSKEYSNQVTCHNVACGFGGQTCTIYDPTLKLQVPIDMNNGVVNSCSAPITCKELFMSYSCSICQNTYTDSMGNTWKGKSYYETVTK